jgi:hypothetical protein
LIWFFTTEAQRAPSGGLRVLCVSVVKPALR